MTRELILGASLLTCMAAPLATAEKLPPHSDYYDQHPHPNPNKPTNDVALLVYRAKGKADLYVSNFCLGKASGPAGAPAYPNEALVRTARVKHHRISFT